MKKYLVISIILSLLSFFLVFSILQNYLVYSAVRRMDIERASSRIRTAVILPKIINLATFKQIEIIKLWEFSLQQLPKVNELKKDTQKYFEMVINNEATDKELPKKIINNLEKINEELNKIDIEQLKEIKLALNDSISIAKKITSNDQKYIVVLQNSDELRATGGFMGSYLALEMQNGQLKPLRIQDIYAPDGQFLGFLEAPSGLAKYTSSGKGMRLPDANWWPNFPDSTEQILYFFEEIEKKDYQGVITINLNTVEQLLDLTGEIYLPDYAKSVNKNNFSAIAREDRNEFFPGSQEKANFLNHFLKIFKITLSKSIQEQPLKFAQIIKNLTLNKDLQFYSRDSEIEKILSDRQIDGRMKKENQELYYFLVESNVGINKANKLIDRQVTIDIKETKEKITIDFQNNNQFPYVNYQRLYTNEGAILENILIDDKKIDEIDQRIMTTKDGQKWLEIGFLSSTLAKNTSKIEINLSSKLSSEQKKKIFIQKQSGIQKIDYTINYQDQSKKIELLRDQLVNL